MNLCRDCIDERRDNPTFTCEECFDNRNNFDEYYNDDVLLFGED